MHIYLVRVRQRPAQTLYLERKPNASTDDDYIAISHVWGTPETITETVVAGHPGVVKLSPGKRDILSILSRPDVCGSDWFWMDLFCIDQTESPTISIADQLMSIPHVYKSARCVKVLLEHPICADWHATAVDLLISNNWGLDFFKDFTVKEGMHSKFCGPHMVCFDPWFERLWTRQEGLYGKVLDIVPLNLIPCPGEQNLDERADQEEVMGNVSAKTMIVLQFMLDKLQYHGLEGFSQYSEAYFDFVYRRHVDMAMYGGGIGPAADYLPPIVAWRSGRVTTKPRDYVLAVFPDMIGYIPPPNMRTITFPELLADALSQPSIRQHYHIVAKFPAGMMIESEATSLEESMAAWIVEQPNSIGDAYESFTIMLRASPAEVGAAETLYYLRMLVTVEDTQFGRAELPRLAKLFTETVDGTVQMGLAPTHLLRTPADQPDDQTLVRRFLHDSAKFLQTPADSPLKPIVGEAARRSYEAVKNIPDAVFAEELRRCLVFMVCGTSLTTADVILQHASPCILSTPFGELPAVVRLEEREAQRQAQRELRLLYSPPMHRFQGLLVASKTRTGATTVIGRTMIPSAAFRESMKERKEKYPEA